MSLSPYPSPADFPGGSPPSHPPPVDQHARRAAEFQHALFALTPRIWATPLLIILNVAVFVAMSASGVDPSHPTVEGLQAWGANYGPLTASGQWWRLLACTFVHIGVLHIFMNMLFLFLVGPFVERLLGHAGFLITYVLTGIAASMTSVIAQPMLTSAGASGALFGLYGSILGFVILRRDSIPGVVLRRQFTNAAVFLGCNLVYGAMPGSHIDMYAHGGGLVSGFLAGMLLSEPLTVATGRAMRRRRNWITTVVGAAALLVAVRYVPRVLVSQGITAELDDISSVVDRASVRHDHGELSDADLAVVLNTALDRWVDEGQRLDAIDPRAVTRTQGEREVRRLARLTVYVAARGRHWALWRQALISGDPDMAHSAAEAGAYADRLRAYLRTSVDSSV